MNQMKMQDALGPNGPGANQDLMSKLDPKLKEFLEKLVEKLQGLGGQGGQQVASGGGGSGGGGGGQQVAKSKGPSKSQGAKGSQGQGGDDALGPAAKKFLEKLAEKLGPQGIQALAQQNPALGQAMSMAGINAGGGGGGGASALG